MKPSRITVPPPITKQTSASLWEPVRLLLAALGGLLVVAIIASFLDKGAYEEGQFGTPWVTFLKGQMGFSELSSMPWFWGMLVGFVLGAVPGYFAGYLISSEIPQSHRPKVNRLALGAALFLIPVLNFIPAMSAGFIWDDDQEVTANSMLARVPDPHQPSPGPNQPVQLTTNWRGLYQIWTAGLTSDKDSDEGRRELAKPAAPWLVKVLRPPLRWVEKEIWGNTPNFRFDANQFADYFPVKTTFLWVEYQIWGHDLIHPPVPPTEKDYVLNIFHIMNILTHALDGVLLWIVLRRLSVPGAWLGALLFVIHPVHAESVAWVAERKNTLSLCFCLLSLMAWLRFEDSKKWTKYTWALLLFLAALLCKTHVVVFPAVLMLLSWWRTGSIPVITPAIELFRSMGKGEKPAWQLFNYDLARFVPFFVLTGALSLVTVWFQNDRAIGSEVIPIGDFNSRLAGASVVVWCYLSKALLPISLNTIYANTSYLWWPLTNPKFWMFLAGALVPMTLLCTFFINQIYPTWKPRADRTPFFVFAFFVGTLFPVLGFFTMSYMRLTLQADHFQYFSDISIVAAVGAIIAILYSKANNVWRPVMVSACVVLVFSCCAYTWERAGVHWSEKTLWEACLKKNEASWQAHNHIGAVYYSEQRFSEAAPHFARAVELKPANPEVHNNLGLVLELAGRRPEAIKEFEKAVEIKGEVVALRGNLARAYVQSGRFTDAADQFKAMLKEVPLDPNVHTMLGSVYAQLNRLPEAKQEFEEALRIDPNNPQAKQNCELLRRMGK